jgi:hypothetical protein
LFIFSFLFSFLAYSKGNLLHSRNLDFGLFLGWDKLNHTWALAEKLRPLLFNAHMIKGGVSVYNATVFAGVFGRDRSLARSHELIFFLFLCVCARTQATSGC